MFIAALFVIVITWEQPKCLLTKEWIKNVVNLHSGVLFSGKKNNDIMKFTDKWMELEKKLS